MSSSIFFKFKSQKQPTQITFDGTSLSVFEVKRDIIALSKLGDGTDFDLDIYSADTNEVYDDDTTQIPRSTTVVARRLPASRPGAGRAARYVSGKMPVTAKNQHRIEAMNKISATAAVPQVQLQSSAQPMTEEEKLAAMFSENQASWQQAQAEIAAKGVNNKPFIVKTAMAAPDKPVPDGYICHRCGQKGHWIQACPTNGDPKLDGRPKLRRTTGIPKSFLQKIDQPDAFDEDGKVDVSKLPAGVMYTPEGEWVIARPDEAAWEKFQKQTQANAVQQKVAADETKRIQELGLECPLSHALFEDPVKTPCCNTTYSRAAIENELIEKDLVCPNCGKQVLIDDLSEDTETITKVKAYKEEAAERQKLQAEDAATTSENEEVKSETAPAEETKTKSPSPTPLKKRAAEHEPEDDRKAKVAKNEKSAASKQSTPAAMNSMPKDMAQFVAQMNQMVGTMPGMQNGMPAFANPMMMMNPMMMGMGMPMMPNMMPNMGMMNPGQMWQNGQGFQAPYMNNSGQYRQPVNPGRGRQRQNRPKSNDYKPS